MLAILLVLLAQPYSSYEGCELLYLNPGSRAAALAGAGAEFDRAVLPGFHNPAALGFVPALAFDIEDNFTVSDGLPPGEVRQYQVFSVYRHWTAGFALPLPGRTAIGLSVTGLDTDRHRLYIRYPGFHDTDRQRSVRLGAAWRPDRYVALGVAARHHRSLARWTFPWYPPDSLRADGSSLSFDFGFLADAPLPLGRLRGAFAGLNFGPAHELRTEGRERPVHAALPRTLRLSAGYGIGIEELRPGIALRLPEEFRPFHRWLVDNWRAELNYTLKMVKTDPLTHAFGLEVRPLPVLAARVGYLLGPDHDTGLPEEGPLAAGERTGWTWGVGLDLKYFRLSVAWDRPLQPYTLTPCRPRYELAFTIGRPFLPERDE